MRQCVSIRPSRCDSSPLADLPNPEDVGEESFLVSDDQRVVQLPVVQEVFGQNAERPQVRGL